MPLNKTQARHHKRHKILRLPYALMYTEAGTAIIRTINQFVKVVLKNKSEIVFLLSKHQQSFKKDPITLRTSQKPT